MVSSVLKYCYKFFKILSNNIIFSSIKNIWQMLRKSVETRDWLHTIEPRTVRAVMKRILEDLSVIEGQVGLLYEEGQKSERSSDSSRKTGVYRYANKGCIKL